MGVGGVCSLSNYSVAYEETQSNRVSYFRDFVCSLFPKAILFDNYFNTKWLIYNNMDCLRFYTIPKVILYFYPVLVNLSFMINDLSITWNML